MDFKNAINILLAKLGKTDNAMNRNLIPKVRTVNDGSTAIEARA